MNNVVKTTIFLLLAILLVAVFIFSSQSAEYSVTSPYKYKVWLTTSEDFQNRLSTINISQDELLMESTAAQGLEQAIEVAGFKDLEVARKFICEYPEEMYIIEEKGSFCRISQFLSTTYIHVLIEGLMDDSVSARETLYYLEQDENGFYILTEAHSRYKCRRGLTPNVWTKGSCI